MQIKDLHKKYGSKTVLNNIDLYFPKGKITGVVGENGAGKTTLFRCIMGLEQYDGSIFYENKTIKNIAGYLSTSPLMLPYIRGIEYLRLVSKARGKTAIIDFEQKNIFELPLNEYADRYSTGMKKKLALMALLLCDNEVYILDEPFNGVDISSNILIKAILDELKKEGKTIILSSHLFTSLYDTCDGLFLLDKGEIALSTNNKDEFGDVEQILLAKAKTNIIQKLWS